MDGVKGLHVGEPPMLADAEMLDVKASYTAALASYPPEVVKAGYYLWEDIASPQWALEWSLPSWLGAAFGLPLPMIRRLTLCNVLGLAYIRLQDDLADDEIGPDAQTTAQELAAIFYHHAVQHYARLFSPGSCFWKHLENCMAQWRQATLCSHEPPSPVPFGTFSQDDYLCLAQRGAPLKICVGAVCLLVEQEMILPVLCSALDHLLTGMVLLDHADDWEQDLNHGRYNAFVAYASPLPQEPSQYEANRHNVLVELLTGGGGRRYFDVACAQIRLAGEMAQPLQIPGLDAYLAWLGVQARAYGAAMASSGRAIVREATQWLFGGCSATELPATHS